jgi:hypothetical protein
MAVLLSILNPLDSKHLAMSTHKPIHPKSVDNDRFLSEIVNHVRKRDRLSSKIEWHDVIFHGMVDQYGASWMKKVRRVERMQILGDHPMRPRSISLKNCTQLGANNRNFKFPF